MFNVLFAATVSTSALAEPVKLDFQPPAEVSMFESLRFVDGKGKLKGGTCEEAVTAALADARTNAASKRHPTVVAVFDQGKRGNWARPENVECEVKGKNIVVSIEALAIREGTDPAFMKITSDRVLEIADIIVIEGAMVQLQLQTFDLEAYKGGAYYRTVGLTREEVFPPDANRNTRAVTVYREQITPQIEELAKRIQGVPEIAGFHVAVGATAMNKKGETEGEAFHLYAPTDAALAFANGDITEQQLIESGAFLYADGNSNPVKMDISFVMAED